MRLDKYLLLKSFYNTRSSAQNNIKLGNVSINNKIVNNCHLEVNDNDVITINKTNQYVSRGAYKLLGAIDEFKIDFNNQVVLDIGSSTGGFTQVAIQFGAKHVYSVDVGTDQMDKTLRSNPKITLYEQTHFNQLTPSMFNDEINFVVADLSFISLTKLIDKLVTLFTHHYKLVLLIKPQFELSKEEIDHNKGKVKEAKLHEKAKNKIKNYAQLKGFKNIKISQSPITGNKGKNVEFLLYMEQ